MQTARNSTWIKILYEAILVFIATDKLNDSALIQRHLQKLSEMDENWDEQKMLTSIHADENSP